MNYIEFHNTKTLPEQIVRAIHYPDISRFEIDLTSQHKVEEITLGSIGNPVKRNEIFDCLAFDGSAKLNKVILYVNSADPMPALEWVDNIGTDTTSKFVFDEYGRLVDLEASLEENKIILRGE